MKPSKSILDPAFQYRNHASTDVLETWRRHGFRPTTQAERDARKAPPPPELLRHQPHLAIVLKK